MNSPGCATKLTQLRADVKAWVRRVVALAQVVFGFSRTYTPSAMIARRNPSAVVARTRRERKKYGIMAGISSRIWTVAKDWLCASVHHSAVRQDGWCRMGIASLLEKQLPGGGTVRPYSVNAQMY